jgi:hypothetical protein
MGKQRVHFNTCGVIIIALAVLFALLAWAVIGCVINFWQNYVSLKNERIESVDKDFNTWNTIQEPRSIEAV